MVRGQCIGGMVQGLGTALCEGYIYDEQGRLLNPSFTDNKIPTAKDIPAIGSRAWSVETAQLDGPFGARGVGEHPMISVAPAIGNAIQHATGVELLHMPIRVEDVWRACGTRSRSTTGSPRRRSGPAARSCLAPTVRRSKRWLFRGHVTCPSRAERQLEQIATGDESPWALGQGVTSVASTVESRPCGQPPSPRREDEPSGRHFPSKR